MTEASRPSASKPAVVPKAPAAAGPKAPPARRWLRRRTPKAAVAAQPPADAAARGNQRPRQACAQRVGLRRRQHPGPRGPRGRSQAPGHVHRLDRRPRPASPGLGGRRQLDRRGDGRPGHDHQGHHQGRRHGDGRGRRPRRAGRQAFDRQGRARSRPHRPPRRRQVRRGRLQGLGRSARRGGQRRQRPVVVDARRIRPRRLRLGTGVRTRQAQDRGQEDGSAGHASRDDSPASSPTRRCSRPPSTRST